MKMFIALASVVIFLGAACTRNGASPESAQVMVVDDIPAKCTVKDINDCTSASGGLTCFSRCGFQPSNKFCSMEALDKCLDSKGGGGCYKKHCGDSVHSGPFTPPSGEGLMLLPERGYGYETFDVPSMRYGKPRTIARVKELATRVYNKTGYKIFVGDLSNSAGGNGGRHAGHYDGVEVDIAVMGNTPTVSCYNIWEQCYLRSASVTMVQEILQMGGSTSILFNDSAVQAKFPGFVSNARGHDNHYHVNWHR
jgi:hypothetical protein